MSTYWPRRTAVSALADIGFAGTSGSDGAGGFAAAARACNALSAAGERAMGGRELLIGRATLLQCRQFPVNAPHSAPAQESHHQIDRPEQACLEGNRKVIPGDALIANA